MQILLKVGITAVALWAATVLIDGIALGDQTTGRRVLTLVAVAVIFGLVNAGVPLRALEPGTIREIQRQYALEWSGWGRTPPRRLEQWQ